MKFKVGDIIVNTNDDGEDYGHKQVITEIHDNLFIYTEYLGGNRKKNCFRVGSVYYRYCEVFKQGNTWDGNVLKFKFV